GAFRLVQHNLLAAAFALEVDGVVATGTTSDVVSRLTDRAERDPHPVEGAPFSTWREKDIYEFAEHRHITDELYPVYHKAPQLTKVACRFRFVSAISTLPMCALSRTISRNYTVHPYALICSR